MSNELAKAGQTAPAFTKEPINAGGAVNALVPQNIEQAFRLAQALAQSGDMVPRNFQGEPYKIMAAIARGMEGRSRADASALAHRGD